VRGLYDEGWDPSKTPIKMKAEEFLVSFAAEVILPEEEEPDRALRICARVLRRHVSPGETQDVLSSLPLDIRRLLK
jgi:uncharacterized protein (DUF2267 family)